MLLKRLFPILLAMALFSGCAINPVTGKQELALVSETQEIRVGQEQYGPSRQMQGGDYLADPALTNYVNGVGRKLAAVSDRKLPYEFTVINDSTPNAWALPGGKIAVNRGLLTELNNESELAAVLGHEMVHAAARHGAKAMERGMLLQGAVLATGIAISDSNYGELGIMGAQLAASMVNQKYSRDAERESDMYGMEYMAKAGYNPNAAVSLQEVFVKLSESRQQNWLNGLFSSHPPSMERVADNRKKALELGAAGSFGAEQYQLMTAHLKKTKPAYEACDKGKKALSEGKTEEALALAQKAIDGEPGEALFHALRGDVRYVQRNYNDALINYDRAIGMNPTFFHFFVQRGLTKEKLGDRSGAKNDLQNSLKMLPTASAYKALGDISLAQGDRQGAVKYYEAASGSSSEAGKAAMGSLVRMDLPSRPSRYLNAWIGLAQDGYAYAQVVNQTPVSIKNINMIARVPDSSGRIREIPFSIRQSIAPGQAASARLPVGPVKDTQLLKTMSVIITNAQAAETR